MGINTQYSSNLGGISNVAQLRPPKSLGDLLNARPKTAHIEIVGNIFSYLKNDQRSARALSCVSRNLNSYYRNSVFSLKLPENGSKENPTSDVVLSPQVQEILQTLVSQSVQTAFAAERERAFFSPQMQQMMTACMTQAVQTLMASEKDQIIQWQNKQLTQLSETQKKQEINYKKVVKDNEDLQRQLAIEINRSTAFQRQRSQPIQVPPAAAPAAAAQINVSLPLWKRVLASVKNGALTCLKFLGRHANVIEAGVLAVAAGLSIAFPEFAPLILLAAGGLCKLLDWISQKFH